MTLLTRLRYALYLAAVCGAVVGLLVAIASADAISLLPISAFDTLFSPYYFLIIYATSFVISPWVAKRFPIQRGEQ